MRGHHLTLTRIAAIRIKINLHRIRSHRQRLFCVDNTAVWKGPMADDADKDPQLGDQSSALNAENKEEKDKKLLPPPPENPLPGDCCGSGCVRCVWDIYYEELEDYNKILSKIQGKSIPGSK